MPTTIDEKIETFLAGGPWAVVGASGDRSKYGNKVLRSYQQKDRSPLYPINPRGGLIEGLPVYALLADAPEVPRAASIITPHEVTEQIVEQAIELGIEHLWMQPGSESNLAVERAEQAGISVIHGGPCVLVVQGYRE